MLRLYCPSKARLLSRALLPCCVLPLSQGFVRRRSVDTSTRTRMSMMDVSLVRIDLRGQPSAWAETVKQTAMSTRTRVYAWFQDSPSQRNDIGSLQALATLYEAVGRVAPTLDVVPLLPVAGWTKDRVSAITDITSVVVPHGEDSAFAEEISTMNEQRVSASLGELSAFVLSPTDTGAEQPAGPRVEILDGSSSSSSLEFCNVAVGGTFDSLHAGHRLLLAMAALVTSKTVWLGIASDALLAKKSNIEVMEKYEEREKNAVSFLQRVRPGLAVRPGALTDPAAPPLAATMQEMQALVVSKETTAGAKWINDHRASQGFEPLEVVVVGLIGADSQDASAAKLSSSALRQAKAQEPQPEQH